MTDHDIRRELLDCLEYQRSSVRSAVEGLAEEAWPIWMFCAEIIGQTQYLRSRS
jgi:hypothetical protein